MDKSIEQLVDCPVCLRKYAVNIIEEHVNKCLFLNSSNNSEEPGSKFDPPHTLKRKSMIEITSKVAHKLPSKPCTSPSPKKPLIAGTKQSDLSNFIKNASLQVFKDNTTNNRQESSLISEKKKVENNVVTNDKTVKNKFDFSVPLAYVMRPKTIDEFFGQTNTFGKDSALRKLLKNLQFQNLILWGPPGCGKTSVALIVEEICKNHANKFRCVIVSATQTGVKDIKSVLESARVHKKFGKKTILFLDEIHRFDKRQQQIFLSCIEKGEIVLIGATTENPSFFLINTLLSRCQVIVFEKLSSKILLKILVRALKYLEVKMYEEKEGENCVEVEELMFHKSTIKWMADVSDGDARIALNNLQIVLQSLHCKELKKVINVEDIKDQIKKTHILYDRNGEEHYNQISALHKSIRGSDLNASVYWTTRMIVSGENPMFIARRLVRAASEDIGFADHKALELAVTTMESVKSLGMPHAEVLLVQCASYLAKAPKSRDIDNAIGKAKKLVDTDKHCKRLVPWKLINDSGYTRLDGSFMPKGLENITFFKTI